jgi:hypothetical protein
LLESKDYQWNNLASNGGGVNCDHPTMTKLVLDYSWSGTMLGPNCHCEIIQRYCLEKHVHGVIKAMEETETSLTETAIKQSTTER